MARLFLPPERLTGERVVLEQDPHKYLHKVLRLSAGDRVVIFDGRGNEIDAEIESSSPRATTLRLGARRSTPAPATAVTLWQAIPRGERMDLLVQKTTELGLARLRPVISERCVAVGKGGGGEGDGGGRLRRWRTIAEEAARQCGRADLPIIDAPVPLAQALGEAAAADELRLFLWEEQVGAPLRRAFAGGERAVTLLVGPEGGFAPAEAAAAQAAGFRAVGLGRRILRSETAAVVAVALTQAALGELD